MVFPNLGSAEAVEARVEEAEMDARFEGRVEGADTVGREEKDAL